MPAVGGQYTAWTFTIHNIKDEQQHPEDHPKNWQGFKYLCYQLEKCPDTGKLHWQGYVCWVRKKALGGCKKVHGTAHWEPRRGTHEQARDYCKKQESRCSAADSGGIDVGPHEFGDEPAPGKRNDLAELKELVDSKAPETELWDNHFSSMVRYSNGIMKYRMLRTTPRDFKSLVSVFYGPTGTGKTKWIRDFCLPEKTFWMVRARSDGDPWMDGYDPELHENVVLDEFYGWIKWDTLLRMLDRYPYQMEVKGGKVQFKPKCIWITSNKRPEDWYKTGTTGRDFETLLRRINLVRHYTAMGVYTVERAEFDGEKPWFALPEDEQVLSDSDDEHESQMSFIEEQEEDDVDSDVSFEF